MDPRRRQWWFFQTDIVAVQRVYYNQIYSFGYQWMLVTSTQLVSIRTLGGRLVVLILAA